MMLKNILHIGLTVKDINKSIEFYQDILGLNYKGKLVMEGEETSTLFGIENCKAEVAYLNGNDDIMAPSIELIQFIDTPSVKNECNIQKISISEVCFKVDDIESFYEHLVANKVECLSEPQKFDFTEFGFGKSKAIYFKDPNGIILEAIEELE